jgi:Ca-activated chloride channel family protein
MNLDPDDPRLTAFALGELDATEYALVEAIVIESAECRSVVEEIRFTARLLSEQLQAEADAHAASMSVNHHAVADSLLKPPAPQPAPRQWWRPRTMLLQAVAALLLVGIALSYLPNLRVREGRVGVVEPAHRAEPPAGAATNFGLMPKSLSRKPSIEIAFDAKADPARARSLEKMAVPEAHMDEAPGPRGGPAPAGARKAAPASGPTIATAPARGSLGGGASAPVPPASGPAMAAEPSPGQPAPGPMPGGEKAAAPPAPGPAMTAAPSPGPPADGAPLAATPALTHAPEGRPSTGMARGGAGAGLATTAVPLKGEALAYNDLSKSKAEPPAPEYYAFYYKSQAKESDKAPQAKDAGARSSGGLPANKRALGADTQSPAPDVAARDAQVLNRQVQSPKLAMIAEDENQKRSASVRTAGQDSYADRGGKSDGERRRTADHETPRNSADQGVQLGSKSQSAGENSPGRRSQQNTATGASQQDASRQGMEQKAGVESRDQKTVSQARQQRVAAEDTRRNEMSTRGQQDDAGRTRQENAAGNQLQQNAKGLAPEQGTPASPAMAQNGRGDASQKNAELHSLQVRGAPAQNAAGDAKAQNGQIPPQQEPAMGRAGRNFKQEAEAVAEPQDTVARARQNDSMGMGGQGAGGGRFQEEQREFARMSVPQSAAKRLSANVDKPFERVSPGAQSTFSIDVGSASYSTVRRFLNRNVAPPADSVRIEEMLNYFPAHDPPPAASAEHPFAIHAEIAGCPWNAQHRLARIGVAARPIDQSRRAACNFVFLVETSGSTAQPNNSPRFQWGVKRLVEQLGEQDRVAIVVQGAASGVVLPSTSCTKKAEILAAIDDLSTANARNRDDGARIAYDIAAQNYINNGTNRVLLVSEGPLPQRGEKESLLRLAEAKAQNGVVLSLLSDGLVSRKETDLAEIAQKTKSQQWFLDSRAESYQALVAQTGATAETVARDVEIQVELNPTRVAEFRLLGYENPALSHEGLANEGRGSGTTISAGHHVTALYEIAAPQGGAVDIARAAVRPAQAGATGPLPPESLTVRLYYAKPGDGTRRVVEQKVIDSGIDFVRASNELRLAAAVAGFGMLLRHSQYAGNLTYPGIAEIARGTLSDDVWGYRRGFVDLIDKAANIRPRTDGNNNDNVR